MMAKSFPPAESFNTGWQGCDVELGPRPIFLLCWLLPTAQATARLRLPALALESPQKQHVGRHRAKRAASAGLQGFGGGGEFYTHTAYRQHGFKPIFNEICCQVQSKQLKRGVLGSWYRTKGTVGQDMLKVFMVKGICGLNCMGRQEAKKGAAVAAWSKQTGPAGREGRRWGY